MIGFHGTLRWNASSDVGGSFGLYVLGCFCHLLDVG